MAVVDVSQPAAGTVDGGVVSTVPARPVFACRGDRVDASMVGGGVVGLVLGSTNPVSRNRWYCRDDAGQVWEVRWSRDRFVVTADPVAMKLRIRFAMAAYELGAELRWPVSDPGGVGQTHLDPCPRMVSEGPVVRRPVAVDDAVAVHMAAVESGLVVCDCVLLGMVPETV